MIVNRKAYYIKLLNLLHGSPHTHDTAHKESDVSPGIQGKAHTQEKDEETATQTIDTTSLSLSNWKTETEINFDLKKIKLNKLKKSKIEIW